MADIQISYEQSPNRLKEFLQNQERSNGISSSPSRSELKRTHSKNIELLKAYPPPLRNMILPLPYFPSNVSILDKECRKVSLKDIAFNTHDTNIAIIVRIITDPYVFSATVTLIEDERGDAARLTVCNLDDSVTDPVLPQGIIIGIKQPCFTLLPDGTSHIQVDHPSDIVEMDEDDPEVPQYFKSSVEGQQFDSSFWLKEGDAMFLERKYRFAHK